MIFRKLWRSIMAQINSIANVVSDADPTAQMQYEYDLAVEELKSGREGLVQQKALIASVGRQVSKQEEVIEDLTARIKLLLSQENRELAAKFALELERANESLAEYQKQLKLHEESYEVNVNKIKTATRKLADVERKIQQYDADLKLARAEAEVNKLAESFEFDPTSNFTRLEGLIHEKIDLEHAKIAVGRDIHDKHKADFDLAVEKQREMDALEKFENAGAS